MNETVVEVDSYAIKVEELRSRAYLYMFKNQQDMLEKMKNW